MLRHKKTLKSAGFIAILSWIFIFSAHAQPLSANEIQTELKQIEHADYSERHAGIRKIFRRPTLVTIQIVAQTLLLNDYDYNTKKSLLRKWQDLFKEYHTYYYGQERDAEKTFDFFGPLKTLSESPVGAGGETPRGNLIYELNLSLAKLYRETADPRILKFLYKGLDTLPSSDEAQEERAKALAEIKRPEIIPQFKKYLEAKSFSQMRRLTRMYLIKGFVALYKHHDPKNFDFFPVLAQLFYQVDTWNERYHVKDGLSSLYRYLGDKRPFHMIINDLDFKLAQVLQEASLAMPNHTFNQSVEALIENKLKLPLSENIAFDYADLLGTFGNKDALPYLVTLMNSEHYRVVQKAANKFLEFKEESEFVAAPGLLTSIENLYKDKNSWNQMLGVKIAGEALVLHWGNPVLNKEYKKKTLITLARYLGHKSASPRHEAARYLHHIAETRFEKNSIQDMDDKLHGSYDEQTLEGVSKLATLADLCFTGGLYSMFGGFSDTDSSESYAPSWRHRRYEFDPFTENQVANLVKVIESFDFN